MLPPGRVRASTDVQLPWWVDGVVGGCRAARAEDEDGRRTGRQLRGRELSISAPTRLLEPLWLLKCLCLTLLARAAEKVSKSRF